MSDKDSDRDQDQIIAMCHTSWRDAKGIKDKKFSYSSPVAIKLDENAKSSWVQLFRPGKWAHPEYGTLNLTAKHFDGFVRNFDENVRGIDLAVDQEHSPELGAAGWFRKIQNRGEDGLWALIEWTKTGIKMIKENLYRYLSAEFDYKWENEENGKKFTNVLFGAALTNRPFIKGMAPINLSEYVEELKADEEIGGLIDMAKTVMLLSEGEVNMKTGTKLGEHGDSDVVVTAAEEDSDAKTTAEEKTTISDVVDLKEEDSDVVVSAAEKDEDSDAVSLTEAGEDEKVSQTGSKGEGDIDAQAKAREKEERKENASLSEKVPVGCKYLATREHTMTIRLVECKDRDTRKLLRDTVRDLREVRMERECERIDAMLNKHFHDGKLAPEEKALWEEILLSEVGQLEVAVYKLSEGKEDKPRYHSLKWIVNKILGDRPPVVEFREMSRTQRHAPAKAKELVEEKETGDVAKRVAERHGGSKTLAESKSSGENDK